MVLVVIVPLVLPGAICVQGAEVLMPQWSIITVPRECMDQMHGEKIG